jgi:hypothetical protein
MFCHVSLAKYCEYGRENRTYRIYDFRKIIVTKEVVEIQIGSICTVEQKPCWYEAIIKTLDTVSAVEIQH